MHPRSPAPAATTAPSAMPRYTRVAIVFHWLIALLMLVNVVLMLTVEWFPDGLVRPVFDTHKSIGVTVLGLVLLRLLWRLSHPAPPLPAAYPRWERWSAHAVHLLLYGVMLWMPLSGWLHDSAWKDAAAHPMYWFGTFEWPRIGFIAQKVAASDDKEALHDLFGWMHSAGAYVLYALFFLHLAGALKHQFLDKEPVLRRMLP
ncbi:cytochrome b [Sphingomonas sp. NCPPB 2930]